MKFWVWCSNIGKLSIYQWNDDKSCMMREYQVRFRERFGVKFSLSIWSRRECEYYIVFTLKYRRQVIYKDIKTDVGQILGALCRRKGIEIIEAECCSDHIHMPVRIPPKCSVSEIAEYPKGKSSLMIFEKHANLKDKYVNRYFWRRGYYVDTVEEYSCDQNVYPETAERRFRIRPNVFSRVYRSVV